MEKKKCEKCGHDADFIGVIGQSADKFHCPKCYHISHYNAGVAQSAEHLPCKQDVGGSIPLTSSIFKIIWKWIMRR